MQFIYDWISEVAVYIRLDLRGCSVYKTISEVVVYITLDLR